jgi:hypothetical protein
LLAACQPTAEAPSAPPKLTFAQTVHDFGRVAQGTPVEYRFPFVNDGGADLTIINLRAACDCEATLEGGPEVAPRAAGAVRGRFDTDAVYGSQRRTITVYSNDPTQHAVMLTLSGEVVLDVAADPPQVYLGVVPPNVPLLREVALRSGSETLRIGTPHSEAAQLTLQLAAAAPHSGAAAILAIGTAPAAQSGPFSGVVQIPTTSPQHPVLRITVSGIIDPAAPTPRPPGAVVPEGSGTGTEGSGPGVQ